MSLTAHPWGTPFTHSSRLKCSHNTTHLTTKTRNSNAFLTNSICLSLRIKSNKYAWHQNWRRPIEVKSNQSFGRLKDTAVICIGCLCKAVLKFTIFFRNGWRTFLWIFLPCTFIIHLIIKIRSTFQVMEYKRTQIS